MNAPVPFERLAHVLVLPVTVGPDTRASFILDSGIGVAILDEHVAATVGVRPDGRQQRGRRMSGQEIVTTLARLPELRLGSYRWSELTVALADLRQFLPPEMAHVAGFLSLAEFERLPLRIDYAAGTVLLDPPPSPSDDPAREVPLHLVREGHALSAQADLRLPSGSTARVEVDLGSDCLILHDRYMAELGFDPEAPTTRAVRGKDETGHDYLRRFGALAGAIAMGAATQRDPPVMFQEIIYDGLVGDQFLRRFEVTFDVPRARLALRSVGA